ncbi:MAG: ABC transporter permease [Acidobacteriota bacterium]
MSSSRMSHGGALSGALLSACLRLYPSDFRAAFGDEMREVFAARRDEIHRRRGLAGVLALWARTLPGLVRAAVLERFDRGRPSPRLPRKRSNTMDRWFQDLRYSLRTLLRSPAFTAVAVLTLALAIGVNTTVFSLVNALLLRPLPLVQDPSRLVVLFTGTYGDVGVSSYLDYRDFAERTRALSGFAAYKPRGMDFTSPAGTERIDGMMVTGNYFDVLGVRPELGRFFTAADDDEPGAETVAVLSHDLWQSAYGGAPDVVGRTIRLNGLAFDIVGVAPPGFRGTALEYRPQVFAPMMMQPHFMPSSGMLLDRRGWGGILTVGRLADDISLQQARDDFDAIGDWLHETYPRFTEDREYDLVSLPQGTLMPSDRQAVVQVSTLLAVVVAMVLLVACVNVASLMLSRALRRRGELAVRQALGAGRGRLLRQLLIESLVLSAIGGVAGLLVAIAGRGVLERLPFPFALDFSFDGRILAFTVALTALTGLAFGIGPALAATRVDIAGPMRGSSQRTGGRRFRLGGALVVGQVALSLILLIAAGLFARTLIALGRTDLGFEPDNVVIAAVDPSLQGYEGFEVRDFYRRLVDRVAALPGVASVSLATSLPAGGGDSLSYDIEGAEAPEGGQYLGVTAVGAGYFETMGIALVRGRGFTGADDADGEPVIVINERAARRLRDQLVVDPMEVRVSFSGSDGPFARIVGIAADSKNGSLREAARPMAYLPAEQQTEAWYAMVLLARTSGADPEGVVPVVRAAVHEVDPNVPAFSVGTLAGHLSDSLSQERLVAGLVGFAAALALLLASIGLYGVLSYAVTRRTREMGIRMALGARTTSVRYLVVRQALLLMAIGGMLGLVGSLAVGSLLSGFLYGVTAGDPLTYALVVGALVAVALAASYVPARRATRVDPLIALRSE